MRLHAHPHPHLHALALLLHHGRLCTASVAAERTLARVGRRPVVVDERLACVHQHVQTLLTHCLMLLKSQLRHVSVLLRGPQKAVTHGFSARCCRALTISTRNLAFSARSGAPAGVRSRSTQYA
eukprot:350600-Chlamydomonas_euryale.AAC.5